MTLNHHPKTTGLLAAAMALSLAACVGTVGDPPGSSTSSDSDPPGTAPSNDVGSVVMHRLSNVEYDNTVRDLLGDTTQPSQLLQFERDLGGSGFDNYAESMTIDDGRLALYAKAAELLSIAALDASSPARSAILTCDGSAGAEACARSALAPFAARAWRRPVTEAEIARLVSFQAVARAQGESFERGIQLAIEYVLLSPSFIFHVELDPTPNAPAPHPLNDYELASRLSYFLWSSLPDAELTASASAGKLSSDPSELERQARRMLDDPKSDALVRNFTRGWLQTRRLEISTYDPDPASFPAYSASLRASMEGESEAFFKSFLVEDKSAVDMLVAPYTYVDARLATFYGMPAIKGAGFQRTPLTGTHRAGLLTQAAVLRATSLKTRTSPTLRGAFVLGQLLCAPPNPPPPDVPTLEDSAMAAKTVREQLEQHRTNAVCAGCHASMDPLGFGLESFDGIGAWRDTDNGSPIDSTGQFPDGRKFDGAPEMVNELASDPRFTRCLSKQMFTYALGRDPSTDEQAKGGRVDRITAGFQQKNFNLRELIVNLVTDDAFTSRHASGGK